MLSVVVFIASCLAVLAGICYFVYKYAPLLVAIFNGAVIAFQSLTALIPDWLAPFVGIIIVLCVAGLLVKIL